MPWVDKVAGIVQAWYSGNEAGNAIADVLFGEINPSGKLPLTFPARIEDTPSYLSFGSENGNVVYREDIFVGYKWYQARNIRPLFAFGYVYKKTWIAWSRSAFMKGMDFHTQHSRFQTSALSGLFLRILPSP